MSRPCERHLWWTADRQRLVPTGHQDAAVLAYATGMPVAPEHEELVDPVGEPAASKSRPAKKAAAPPPQKRRTAKATKPRRPASDKAPSDDGDGASGRW